MEEKPLFIILNRRKANGDCGDRFIIKINNLVKVESLEHYTNDNIIINSRLIFNYDLFEICYQSPDEVYQLIKEAIL